MEYRILGSLEVRGDGEAVPLGPPKQRATLAVLLLHANEIVPTDQLIESLWGDHPPRTASHSIQIYVSDLRKILERGSLASLVTRPPGYMLTVDPEAIDARRFERLLRQGTADLDAADAAAAASALGEALGLWRGPPLSDFTYEEFAQDEIRRLAELRSDALERLAAANIALGQTPAALASINAAIAADPLRERPRELQLRALTRSGRQPEALRAYEEFRALLAEELGVEPSPSLQEIHELTLIHDPSLGPPAASIPASPLAAIRNPYKGLRPFGAEDAADFFGRQALVAELVAAIASGRRLVALVGPSGSGKSSLIDAGLLPAVGEGAGRDGGRWVIARMMPGRRPFDELGAALGRALPEATPGLLRRLEEDEDDLGQLTRSIRPVDRRLLLVIDQFEELFTVGEESARSRFLRCLASTVAAPEDGVSVVLALRGDFYDRPLMDQGFAPVFTAGVVNILPMTATDLEAAVVGPAHNVGVDVEPALLAQLIADAAGQPGGLPLLQYTLTELFDHRAGPILTLEGYRSQGGLPGAISRRADALFESLPDDRRAAALQVFLRLVLVNEGGRQSRRRVPVSELVALGLDPVALSDVLAAFGRHRLLSFDRDPVAGNPTVEVAHEALLTEWGRLDGWIARYRADLRQRASLASAADEWISSDRDPDYLLIGSRLAEYEAWSSASALRLAAKEREFLAAGIARRQAEEIDERIRQQERRRLERRARSRLWALLGSVAVLVAAAAIGVLSWLGSGPADIALLYEGTGDAGFGDMAWRGFQRAVAEFGLDVDARTVTIGSREVETELRQLSDGGVKLVVVGLGSLAEEAATNVAVDHPGTRYVVWEAAGEIPDNVTNLVFRSEEGAYLAGAAAAMTSRSGILGFIGAWKIPIIDTYLAGFEAGARSIDPEIAVGARYLTSPGDMSAFSSPTLGTQVASQLYAEGADVILAVAGASDKGIFAAATAASNVQGRQLWAIGVDVDEYVAVVSSDQPVPEGQDPATWQPHILTSVTKRLDEAFYTVLAEYVRGELAPGVRSLGLAEHGVDIAYSGGFLDAVRPRVDEIRRRIIAGAIEVPTEPTGVVGAP